MEMVHRCTFCHKAFHKLCSLSTAAASSHLSVGFLCSFGCLQAFETGRAYRKAEVEQPGCKCLQCDKTFSKPGNLKAHVKSEHEKVKHGPCPCCMPRKEFTSRHRLVSHIETRRLAVAEALRQLEEEGTN